MPLRSASSLLTCLVLAAFSLPACADCDHRAPRSADADLDGVTRVEIHAAAGNLEVAAKDGSTLRATGEACASRESLLDEVQIETRRTDDVLRLDVVIPKNKGGSQARLDLRVELPGDLPVRLEDSSGDLEVDGITLEDLDDGSGNIRLSRTRGDLRLEDGSGDVRIRDHRGSLELRDGSGNLVLDEVQGDVLVTDDGSGDIEISRVTGNVEIRDDGSGDIDVDTVSGSLRVGSAGSGSVRHRDVAGEVDVPRD